MSKKLLMAPFVLGVAAVIAGVVFSKMHKSQLPVAEMPAMNAATTSGAVITDLSSGNHPKYQGQALTYLAAPEVLAKYPQSFVQKQGTLLAGILQGIKDHPAETERWIDVGLVKKNFENYTGTRDAWEYLALLNPDNALNHFNLGNLYGYYLHDFPRAEAHYKKAIALSPGIPDFYVALADFYRDAYQAKSDQIDDVLIGGIQHVKGDPNLVMALAYYYKSVGDKEHAKTYFALLLEMPTVTGAQKEGFKAEIAALQ